MRVFGLVQGKKSTDLCDNKTVQEKALKPPQDLDPKITNAPIKPTPKPSGGLPFF